MADYIFTQNGDNNVQIGDMTGMPHHVNIAFKWALEHNYQSVAAQYARTLALEVERLRDENDRLYAALKLAQARARDYDADIEAGRMVRMESCDECRYKLESHAWEYYTYPCHECRQRTKSHFERPEAARAALEGGQHD